MLRRYVYIKFISLAKNILQQTSLKETEIMAKFFAFLLCIILCADFVCKLVTVRIFRISYKFITDILIICIFWPNL